MEIFLTIDKILTQFYIFALVLSLVVYWTIYFKTIKKYPKFNKIFFFSLFIVYGIILIFLPIISISFSIDYYKSFDTLSTFLVNNMGFISFILCVISINKRIIFRIRYKGDDEIISLTMGELRDRLIEVIEVDEVVQKYMINLYEEVQLKEKIQNNKIKESEDTDDEN